MTPAGDRETIPHVRYLVVIALCVLMIVLRNAFFRESQAFALIGWAVVISILLLNGICERTS